MAIEGDNGRYGQMGRGFVARGALSGLSTMVRMVVDDEVEPC